LIRLQIKTSSPYFHWANYTLNKTSPCFLLSFYFSIYALNEIFLLEGKKPKNGGENLSQKLGEPVPKTGGVALDFDCRFGGIEATG